MPDVKQLHKILLQCTQEGDLTHIREVVSQHKDYLCLHDCYYPKSGDTIVHVAARHGHTDVIRFLYEEYKGVHLEQANLDGKLPLHEAAQASQLDCVQYLLSQGVAVDPLKKADWTPLMLACTKKNLLVIQTLVRGGADLRLQNKDGWNCFHIACREGDEKIVSCLLDCLPSLWETASKNGRTPLHTAALHGCLEVCKVLLSRCGYKPDMCDSCSCTPLMEAVRGGHTLIADLLISQHGADLCKADKMGRCATHVASQAGCIPSIEHLVSVYNVDLNIRTSAGLTPLHCAAKEGQTEAIRTLLKLGANINTQDNKGRTALHMAAGGRHHDTMKFLLESGSDDVMDYTGKFTKDLII